MEVRWTSARAAHIAHRSDRYPDAADIDVTWTQEVLDDPRRWGPIPESGPRSGVVRIVGYSPSAGFVITVIALAIDSDWWGVTAWKTTGAQRRRYGERPWEGTDDQAQ